MDSALTPTNIFRSPPPLLPLPHPNKQLQHQYYQQNHFPRQKQIQTPQSLQLVPPIIPTTTKTATTFPPPLSQTAVFIPTKTTLNQQKHLQHQFNRIIYGQQQVFTQPPFPATTTKIITSAPQQYQDHVQNNNFQRENLFVSASKLSSAGYQQRVSAFQTLKSGKNSPPPLQICSNESEKQQQKQHPQIWCGKGQTEPTVSKHVYNYAQRKDAFEQTPMCKVAELMRYNKLRHEYVLLDESGPAHKKKFTVKLILCPGQEFEGSGPSIKKAQQVAAQSALDSSPLPRPPLSNGGGSGGVRRSNKKGDPYNEILLLNSVAAQLGIVVHWRAEIVRQSPLLTSFVLANSNKPSATAPNLTWSSFPFHGAPSNNENSLSKIALLPGNGGYPTAPISHKLCLTPPPPSLLPGAVHPSATAVATANAVFLAQQFTQQQQLSNNNNANNKNLTSILDLPVMPFATPATSTQQLINGAASNFGAFSALLPSTNALPLLDSCYNYYYSLFPSCLSPPSTLLLPGISPPSGPFPLITGQLQQQQLQLLSSPVNYNSSSFSYKVTITLSLDSSDHQGVGSQLTTAKQKAAIQALIHLRPVLEHYKRRKEIAASIIDENGSQNTFLAKNQAEDRKESFLAQPNAGSRSSTSGSSEESGAHSSSSSSSPLLIESMINGKNDRLKNGAIKSVDVDNVDGDEKALFPSGIQPNIGAVQRPPRVRRKGKSVVSQVHECAFRLKMNVEFEVLAETGEPHKRVYTLRCRLVSPPLSTKSSSSSFSANNKSATFNVNAIAAGKEFSSEGCGPSKKAAKQAACQQLLEKVRPLLDSDPILLASQIVRQATETTTELQKRFVGGSSSGGNGVGKEQHMKRKTIIKDKKMDPEYGHHINPITRLIQVMQIRQEREPVFHLISEQGHNRHKEFTVSVHCMNMKEQGIGPNKKLAKRAAAEAMLVAIGYVKSMPQPGKSLLKKHSNVSKSTLENIEHFDVFEAAGSWLQNYTCEQYNQQQQQQKSSQSSPLTTFASVEQALRGVTMENCVETLQQKQQEFAMDSNVDNLFSSNNNSKTSSPMIENAFGSNGCSPPTGEEEDSSSPSINTSEKPINSPPLPSTRRRVTFNEHVSACPPPEDSNYPAASIAPLKTELGSRLRRRSRDSQRKLSEAENQQISTLVAQFLRWPNVQTEKRGVVDLKAGFENFSWKGVEDLFKADGVGGNELVNACLPALPGLDKQSQKMQSQQQQQLTNGASSIIPFQKPNVALPPPTFQPSSMPVGFANGFPFADVVGSNLSNLVERPPPTYPIFGSVRPQSSFGGDEGRSIEIEGENCSGDRHKFGLINAKAFVDQLAKLFKFTVAYSDFPKTQNAADDEQCFTLLTVGLSKPIVCHGSGPTEADAHADAACNAIQQLHKQSVADK